MTQLLEGEVMPAEDPTVTRLAREVAELRRAVATAKLEAKQATERTEMALGNLRRQLSPLYRALQMVFGEIEAAGVTSEGDVAAPSAVPGDRARWDAWKARLGPSCAKVIDALLLGGEMNAGAIKVAAKMGIDTVYNCTSKMGQAGILVKNNGKFSLKA